MAHSTTSSVLRIVVERGRGGRDWSASLEGEPQQACGGSSVAAALNRWLQLNRHRFPGPYMAHFDASQSSLDRQVVVLAVPPPCPDCGGSGRYVGLSLVENCRACGGSGLALPAKGTVGGKARPTDGPSAV
ncbi:MAG TPA: hypothetical protein VML55_20890 [Planctomycetaceae bacterium]|nr:hypothetical protein [Planctomycetaceae bacterium]